VRCRANQFLLFADESDGLPISCPGQMLFDLRHTAFRSLRDVGLFLTSARSDARLLTLRKQTSSALAFDRLYSDAPSNDPWAATLPQYQYQRRKYDALVRLLPKPSYRRALDLGCGLGLLTERLAGIAEQVVGIDISAVAIQCAAERIRALKNVQLRQGDIMTLGADLDANFDLVVVADIIYYLPPPILDSVLKSLADRIARLLTPDGVVMLVNHYFPIPNQETRLTRRIHRAFQWSTALSLLAEHRRAFFLVSLLGRSSCPEAPPAAAA
jgi:SAM-dependent methyltransferase